MKQDLHDYDKMKPNGPNRSCECLRERVLANIEFRRLDRNQNNLKKESSRQDMAL